MVVGVEGKFSVIFGPNPGLRWKLKNITPCFSLSCVTFLWFKNKLSNFPSDLSPPKNEFINSDKFIKFEVESISKQRIRNFKI